MCQCEFWGNYSDLCLAHSTFGHLVILAFQTPQVSVFRKKDSKSPREITCSAPNEQLDTTRDSGLITAARQACRGPDIWLSAVNRSQTQLKQNKYWTNIYQMPRNSIGSARHLSPNQMLCSQKQQEGIIFLKQEHKKRRKDISKVGTLWLLHTSYMQYTCMCNKHTHVQSSGEGSQGE